MIRLSSPCLMALCAMVIVMPSTVDAQEGTATWVVDDDRSSITFESNAPAERFTGTSESLEGSIDWNFDRPEESSGTIEFPVETVRTGNRTRDRHLQREDWLHADDHPTITFTVEQLSSLRTATTDGGQIHHRATAEGNLTVRGVEQSTEASVEIAIIPDQNVARVRTQLEFDLDDHGIEGSGGDRAVGYAVGETIEVQGTIYLGWE